MLTVSLNLKKDAEIITEINRLIDEYSIEEVRSWQGTDKHKHFIIHILVNFNKQQAIKALAGQLNQTNLPRVSDGCTPLHLSNWKKNFDLTQLLLDLGADSKLKNNYGEDSAELIELVKKSNNIVFLDLELTAVPNVDTSSILEIAILITDDQLVEIARKEWVVSKPEDVITAFTNMASKYVQGCNRGREWIVC